MKKCNVPGSRCIKVPAHEGAMLYYRDREEFVRNYAGKSQRFLGTRNNTTQSEELH
jgi:hypothetical protein